MFSFEIWCKVMQIEKKKKKKRKRTVGNVTSKKTMMFSHCKLNAKLPKKKKGIKF